MTTVPVRYSAEPTSTRGTPGEVNDRSMPPADTMAWAVTKAVSTDSRPMTRVVAARATALPATSCARRGTAARVGLMVPVAYSPVTATTPRVATAQVAGLIPVSAPPSGSAVASGDSCTRAPTAANAPVPTTSTAVVMAAASSERVLRSLTSSAVATRASVTVPVADRPRLATDVALVVSATVVMRLPSRMCRSRWCTRSGGASAPGRHPRARRAAGSARGSAGRVRERPGRCRPG
jgi:hypothetical protein